MKKLKKATFQNDEEIYEFEDDMELLGDFVFKQVIGTGSYAVVKIAWCISLNRNVAVKIYNRIKLTDPLKMRNLEAEVENLRYLDHINIIKLYHSILGRRHHYLVMDYIGACSLYDYLDK